MVKGNFSRSTKEYYTLREIERAIRYKDNMYSYAERGDLETIHLIVDAERALELSNPTEIQLITVQLVWRENHTLIEAGKKLGVTPQAVKFNLDLLKVKIQKVLDKWKRDDLRAQYLSRG